jgi:hypothetical protein
MMTSSRWSTASFGQSPDSLPSELAALHDHVKVCNRFRGPWFTTQCRAEALHGFMVARLVTTVAATCALVAVLVWFL